ncbi:MAG: class I SAM-dependent RNA methyltransferase [Planctomycetaceae bacterium]|nr:class I SAM-dependent RNA methyltransferase [Planctomycetaceae bacterium]
MNGQLDLIATTAFGLEAVVARELKELGYAEHTITDGRVRWAAEAAAVCRANLQLRAASRVVIVIGEFEARDFGELFEQTKALPWDQWIPSKGSFPVRGRSVKSQLHSVPDCQRIVKKAIAERLKQSHGGEWLEESGPQYGIEISLLNDRAMLTLDTSGDALHRRGYRTYVGEAPLRETLAAALVRLSYWNRERPLVDPFCGTGTIAIEAALIGRGIAPGLGRTFAAEGWPQFDSGLWTSAREEARRMIQPALPIKIIGTDIDARAVALARKHAVAAGVADDVHIQQLPVAELRSPKKYGCIITNPPYGERMGDQRDIEPLYREMGRAFSALDTWSIYVLTAFPAFERLFGRTADRRRKLYNSNLACTYYQFFGPKPPSKRTSS